MTLKAILTYQWPSKYQTAGFRSNLTDTLHRPGAKTRFTSVHQESRYLSVSYHPVTWIPKLYSSETAISVDWDHCERQNIKYLS
jgi:hypothetical protein